MESWQSITVEELEAIIAKQLAACSEKQRVVFAAYRVPFYLAPIHRAGAIESVLVVANLPYGLLYFEDVEEGFEIETPGGDGILPGAYCNQLELTHALYRAGI